MRGFAQRITLHFCSSDSILFHEAMQLLLLLIEPSFWASRPRGEPLQNRNLDNIGFFMIQSCFRKDFIIWRYSKDCCVTSWSFDFGSTCKEPERISGSVDMMCIYKILCSSIPLLKIESSKKRLKRIRENIWITRPSGKTFSLERSTWSPNPRDSEIRARVLPSHQCATNICKLPFCLFWEL